MFKYTRASINMLVDDLKLYAKIFKYVSTLITVIYLVFATILGLGIFFVNIGLLAAFLVFTTLDIVFEKTSHDTAKKVAKKIYAWLKIITKAFTLGFTIYQIYTSPVESTNGVTIILATLMIILWIITFVLEIVVEMAKKRAEIIMVAFKEDVEDIKKPFTAVSNTFKKITGKPVDITEKDDKKIKILDKIKDHINKKKLDDDED